MIPIPQYPLYSATITLYEGRMVPYYLDEAQGWKLNRAMLEQSLAEAKAQGTRVKAICVINPGNPTGAVLDEDEHRHDPRLRPGPRPVRAGRRGVPGEHLPGGRQLHLLRQGAAPEGPAGRLPLQLPLLLQGLPGRVRRARRLLRVPQRAGGRGGPDPETAVREPLRQPGGPGGHLRHGAPAEARHALLRPLRARSGRPSSTP